ncbi:phosphoribosyltransferase family protein [Pseudomonas salmasensis]
MNTWVSFQSAEQPLLGQFSVSGNKVRQNEPQKWQNNRFHQCRNLDGVFSVNAHIPPGPVLLVDDMIDSGWTMTVIAALLKQAGCERVYPLAISSTASKA